jgi:hypothetical protein
MMKSHYTSIKLHGFTLQNVVMFMVTEVKTSDLTNNKFSVFSCGGGDGGGGRQVCLCYTPNLVAFLPVPKGLFHAAANH